MNRNSVWYGLALGIVIPFIGFYLVSGIFDLLVHYQVMDVASASTSSRRLRTICLIALCLNIIPIQLFNKRKHDTMIRGVASGTMLWAMVWLYMFHDTIF